jgi:hypothetical protein
VNRVQASEVPRFKPLLLRVGVGIGIGIGIAIEPERPSIPIPIPIPTAKGRLVGVSPSGFWGQWQEASWVSCLAWRLGVLSEAGVRPIWGFDRRSTETHAKPRRARSKTTWPPLPPPRRGSSAPAHGQRPGTVPAAIRPSPTGASHGPCPPLRALRVSMAPLQHSSGCPKELTPRRQARRRVLLVSGRLWTLPRRKGGASALTSETGVPNCEALLLRVGVGIGIGIGIEPLSIPTATATANGWLLASNRDAQVFPKARQRISRTAATVAP